MAEPTVSTGSIATAVRELSTAKVVAFGGVGIAGQVLAPTEAYHALEAALPSRVDEVRPQISWLLAHGSAAGKVYAATLLARFDPAAARAAWQSLAGDPAGFTTYSGCLMDRTTLGEYATTQLDQR
jgi:hypothetical protein